MRRSRDKKTGAGRENRRSTSKRAQREKTGRKGAGMNRIRGIVMLIAGALAIWKGWQIHRGEMAVLAYGLGALALTVGVWRMTRKGPPVRLQPRP
jgi:hypothetical protein